MHSVAVLALDDLIPFDLTIPVAVFGAARLGDGSRAYDVRVCGPTQCVGAGAFSLQLDWGLEVLAEADTIVIPGTRMNARAVPRPVIGALRAAAARGARIASICAGAFVFAETGLLDGLRATTHWAAASELALQYPEISVEPELLYVDEGQFLTSAGAAAGLDLCLHMVRSDLGSAIAADAARRMVMPPERDGGQSQFIVHEPPAAEGASLEPLLHWMERNLDRPMTVAGLASQAMLSTRTFMRRFREQTGTTPLQWLHTCRIRRAQALLEETDASIESIAASVGFGSPAAFRERFKRAVGTSPQGYRRAFRGSARTAA